METDGEVLSRDGEDLCLNPDVDSMLSRVGDVAEIGPLAGGTGNCIDWDDERRKKGIDEGVRRFD